MTSPTHSTLSDKKSLAEKPAGAAAPVRLDYYFSLVSPWAYIGNAAFHALARKHGAEIVYHPVSLNALFPNSGGTPFAQRHPLRLQYRMMELQRWREKRRLSFHLHPRYWPFDPKNADCCVLALTAAGFDPAAYIAAAFAAVFETERDLASREEIAAILAACGFPADSILAAAGALEIQRLYAANQDRALAAGVFGSPAYLRGGEVFWGQDRLELLDEALVSGRPPFLSQAES